MDVKMMNFILLSLFDQNPLKAKMVKTLEAYPYSSYHHFLKQSIPECLQNAWIVQNHKGDKEAIEAMIESSVDMDILQKLKKASALVEAPNIQKKPDIKRLEKMLLDHKDIQERNKQILKAYSQGYYRQSAWTQSSNDKEDEEQIASASPDPLSTVWAYRNLR